jgi:hypothetical protein
MTEYQLARRNRGCPSGSDPVPEHFYFLWAVARRYRSGIRDFDDLRLDRLVVHLKDDVMME